MRFLLIFALVLSRQPPADEHYQHAGKAKNQTGALSQPAKPPVSAPSQGVTSANEPITKPDSSNSNQQEHQSWIGRFLLDIKITDVAVALFTGLLVLFGAKQANRLRESVDEMKGATQATKNAATEQAKLTVASLGEMRRAADASTDSAKAATTAADAAKESVESYRESERAWISVVEFAVSTVQGIDAATGKQMSGTAFNIRWVNGGRTPAVHCTMYSDHRVVLSPNDSGVPLFDVPQSAADQREMPLIPGVPVNSPQRFIDDADMRKLVGRQCRIFLYGRAEYELVFPRPGGPDSSPRTEVCVEINFWATTLKPARRILLSRQEAHRILPVRAIVTKNSAQLRTRPNGQSMTARGVTLGVGIGPVF